jgi:hypothetical protein
MVAYSETQIISFLFIWIQDMLIGVSAEILRECLPKKSQKYYAVSQLPPR